MNIDQREQGDAVILELGGRVDSESVHQLQDALRAALAQGRHNQVLDMAEVDYLSSAGLRALADALTRCREAGGDLKLVGLQQKVLRVLRIIGFDRFFSCYDSLEAALSDF